MNIRNNTRSSKASTCWSRGAAGWSIVFIAGYLLGCHNGNLMATTTIVTSRPLLLADHQAEPLAQDKEENTYNNDSNNNKNDDGWTTIQVFYGKPSEPDPPASAVDASNNKNNEKSDVLSHQWFAQVHQDEVVANLFKKKRNGFFVDLAANDATIISNTFALERYYGWRGLCIEPNPMYWKNLSAFRQCKIIAAVVGRNRMEQVHFRFKGAEYGGIAAEGFDNKKRFQAQSEVQYTVPLYEILQRSNAPREMEYLSIDVEGAETFILMPEGWVEPDENSTNIIHENDNPVGSASSSSSMQPPAVLDHYRFKVITGERLGDPIRQYLKSKGYNFVKRLSRWGETLWIHQSAAADLDLHVLQRFPKK